MTSRTSTALTTEPVTVAAADYQLAGDLTLPAPARGVVLFAHGSGSSRLSPRNRFVAEQLNGHQLATLLIDLLTLEEEAVDEYTRELRFDIPLLATRLSACADWLGGDERTSRLPLGLFGASTGAAAALTCAADKRDAVDAVVSRGGRPDLAGEALTRVEAATLLIVGGRDQVVIDLNRQAQAQMRCENRLEVVPGATHLFEEPGALETVARLAGDWFTGRLPRHT
ncbi:MAG: hydrolase [Chloroflexota bacterium]|nr:hydrolase [Chloroflexota bacterium]